MLQTKSIRYLAGCMLVMLFISLIPLTSSAVGAPSFTDLSISSFDNSMATLVFNEKVYSKVNPKTNINAENLSVSIEGGTAVLASYSISQIRSRNRVDIILVTNGNADGSEMLIVKPAGASQIYNGSGIPMAADAQITVALRDMSPPEFTGGYPNLQNITGSSADLKIKSNEACNSYYVITKEGNHAPPCTHVKDGNIWHGVGWGPVAFNHHKGYAELQANTEKSVALSGLDPQTRYYIFVVLKDPNKNFHYSTVKMVVLDTGSASGSQAMINSTSYTINNDANTISGVVYGTTLADFTSNLQPVNGAAVQVYQTDGTTIATDLADGYKLVVTAADTTTTNTYTIAFNPALSTAKEITSFSIVNPLRQGIISGNNILVVLPPGTIKTDLVAQFSLSPNATAKVGLISQTSESTANDFSSPVTYIITAEDNSTKTYTVTVVDELENLKNAVLVGKHLFQLDDTNGLTRANVISALSSDSNLWYKSTNGCWYNLLDDNNITSINDLYDSSKAIAPVLNITKWYKAGDTVQNLP